MKGLHLHYSDKLHCYFLMWGSQILDRYEENEKERGITQMDKIIRSGLLQEFTPVYEYGPGWIAKNSQIDYEH